MNAQQVVWSKERLQSRLRHAFLVAIILLVSIPGPASAQGWWWGSRINPGFDRKTVIHVAGTIAEMKIVDQGGPSTLRLQTSDEIFDVVLAPGWFLVELQADFKTGDKLSVEGSRVPDRKGNMYLIAARVTNARTGVALALRDEAGRPLWVTPRPSERINP